MFESKSLASVEGAKQVNAGNKALQRKFTQHNSAPRNKLLTNDTMQFKKIVENQGVINSLGIKPIQREVNLDEEEELLQRQVDPNEEEEEPLQMKKENNTGIPDQLKTGVESLSGIDMSDVRVHYNSDKPSGVGALAYTQGTDIHVAAGQERHLAHEAWHVVQQAQGRVQPTTQLKDVAINDDPGLEHEADVMGQMAMNS